MFAWLRSLFGRSRQFGRQPDRRESRIREQLRRPHRRDHQRRADSRTRARAEPTGRSDRRVPAASVRAEARRAQEAHYLTAQRTAGLDRSQRSFARPSDSGRRPRSRSRPWGTRRTRSSDRRASRSRCSRSAPQRPCLWRTSSARCRPRGAGTSRRSGSLSRSLLLALRAADSERRCSRSACA